ncbi:MAG: beta-lactamase family protein [Bacilli bacterium]|nr:beta-lactamase family protein [Bacilli bacterium]
MDKKRIKTYIDKVYNNQFLGNNEYQNLFTIKDYHLMYNELLSLLSTHGYLPIEDLRDILYDRSKIEEKLNTFIKEMGMAPGAVISYGTSNYNEIITVGNSKEVSLVNNRTIITPKEMQCDTIFDLASVSKMFITLSVVKLVENGLIGINDEITKYCPEFTNLKGVTIFDLITFRVPLITSGKIENASDKGEALDLLHDIKINEKYVKSVYTDMGAMVLKYVVEKATGMPYYHFVQTYILNKANMLETSYRPVDINRVASTNYRTQLLGDGSVKVDVYEDGQVNDPKAQKMESTSGDLCGHAGMFSTASDMTNLALSIIDGSLLSRDDIDNITRNQTGSIYYENDIKKTHQYFGYLCYLKNPILKESEVYHALSGKSFAYAGYTGTQFTVDPVNGVYLFLGSNRVHDRVAFIDPSIHPLAYTTCTNRKMVAVPGEGLKVDSRSFAYDKDYYIVRPLLKLSMQYKMLDDLLIDKDLEPVKRVRKL